MKFKWFNYSFFDLNKKKFKCHVSSKTKEEAMNRISSDVEKIACRVINIQKKKLGASYVRLETMESVEKLCVNSKLKHFSFRHVHTRPPLLRQNKEQIKSKGFIRLKIKL